MPKLIVQLGVRADSTAEENKLVGELQSFLQSKTEDIDFSRARKSVDTQDAGTLLVASLAAPAVVQLAKGVADWMRKRHVSVVISADGSKSLEGPPEHVERILREIAQEQT